MMFDGFCGEDFDAYVPSKWNSNMFTLQRRKVKDKLDLLGKQLTGEFANAGLDLVLHLSDDHPSLWNNKKVDTQWLFFSRDTNAQRELSEIIDTEKTLAATLVDPTPLYRHIFLGVSVNETGLEVGIRLHHDAWVDRKNLLAILEDTEKRNGFLALCQALPDHMGFGLHQNELTAVSAIDEAVLKTFSDEFDTSSKGWMFFGARINKDDVVSRGADVMTLVIDTMNQLAAVYRYIAWSPQNDALSIDNIVEQKKQERLATHEELLQEQKAREEKQRALVAQRQREQEEKKQEMLDEQAWREQERAKRRAAAIARREKEAQSHSEPPAPARNTDTDTAKKSIPAPAAPNGNAVPLPATRESDVRAGSINRHHRERTAAPYRGKTEGKSQDRDNRGKNREKNKSKGLRGPKMSAAAPPKPANVSDERKADIQIGDRIVVVDGFLKDRSGVVQNIDEKGDLKVSFGMLSSRVARQDVKGLGPAL